MISAMEQAKQAELKAAPNPVKQYTGEVVYIHAFDVAYDMARKPIRELLGQPVAQFAVDTSKRLPRHLFFYKPQMIRLPPMERIGPHGAVRVERVVKILPVGAISITVRVPFAGSKNASSPPSRSPHFLRPLSNFTYLRIHEVSRY